MIQLPSNRLAAIDQVVLKIKPKFDANRDFTPLFQQYGIVYYRGAYCPTLAVRNGETDYIFMSSRRFALTEEFSTAHELGHILLGHMGHQAEGLTEYFNIEGEADTFAGKLTGHRVLTHSLLMFVEAGLHFFDRGHRTMISRYHEDCGAYLDWIVRNQLPTPYK